MSDGPYLMEAHSVGNWWDSSYRIGQNIRWRFFASVKMILLDLMNALHEFFRVAVVREAHVY
jgi:hypothetical protein